MDFQIRDNRAVAQGRKKLIHDRQLRLPAFRRCTDDEPAPRYGVGSGDRGRTGGTNTPNSAISTQSLAPPLSEGGT